MNIPETMAAVVLAARRNGVNILAAALATTAILPHKAEAGAFDASGNPVAYEPIYTVTTGGTGTNNIENMSIQVTDNGTTTVKTFAQVFDGSTVVTGTLRKCGTGFLKSHAYVTNFYGFIFVEQGAWLVTGGGQLGRSGFVTKCEDSTEVVVSNGASVVFDVPSGDTSRFFNRMWLSGDGYNDLGAIRVLSAGSGSSPHGNNEKFFPQTQWILLDDASVHVKRGVDAVHHYSHFRFRNHTVTLKGFGPMDISSYFMSYASLFNDSALSYTSHIVVDGLHYGISYVPGYEMDPAGSGESTLTLKHSGGNGDSWLNTYNGLPPTCPWTLRIGDGDVFICSDAGWATTNKASWGGPVELIDGLAYFRASTAGGNSISLLNRVYGEGGITCRTPTRFNLVSGENGFKGRVEVNATRSHEAEGELRVFWPGALPPESEGARLYDSGLTLMYDRSYDLPSLVFDTYGGKTETFSGGTNGFVRSLKKTGAGTLSMTAPLTVTGVTEIADGVLRIPCDRAGLVFGAAYSNNVSGAAGVLGVILTNSVQSGVELAYTDDKERWQRLDPVADSRRRVITYHGYIWNRTDANQNWTFACGMETGAKLFLDGVEKAWENVLWYAFYNDRKIGFVTVPDVTPGCHQIDVRIYTTQVDVGWGTLADRLGVGNIVNATWTNYFGIGIDRQGRGSTHYADYERLLDPGDGSFLTVVPADAANAADVVAHMPQFAHLKFSGGEFDTRGSNLTVPVLEGFGVVTNSNDCYSGTLSVGGKWKVLAGDIAAGRALTVAAGALGFGGDAVLDVEGIEDLPRGEYNIATATGGIVGYPRFKCADRGLSGWHSVRRHDGGTGLDTIKFFWRMGLVVAFQ